MTSFITLAMGAGEELLPAVSRKKSKRVSVNKKIEKVPKPRKTVTGLSNYCSDDDEGDEYIASGSDDDDDDDDSDDDEEISKIKESEESEDDDDEDNDEQGEDGPQVCMLAFLFLNGIILTEPYIADQVLFNSSQGRHGA